MRTLARFALSIGAAAALLEGCVGSQPTIVGEGGVSQPTFTAPEATRQNAPVAPDRSRAAVQQRQGRSWILPRAKRGDLVYATGWCGGVCILTYPGGQEVGGINLGGPAGGDCSNSKGDVFVADDTQVLEFAHGGTKPIATLSLPGTQAAGCGIDQKTGNLAVVFDGSGANVAIFPAATGMPTLYETHILPYYCGYDNEGNLFVSGLDGSNGALAELPSGGKSFSLLSINGAIRVPGQVQWDGHYITFEDRDTGSIKILRLSISGSAATVAGTTRLLGKVNNANGTWIAGSRVILPYSISGDNMNHIGFWHYPKSGRIVVKLAKFDKLTSILDVTLSTP